MSLGSGPPGEPRRVFGFWTTSAIVVGNMIGSGFYLLPASLAGFGWNGTIGWVVTIAGALCLAAVFAMLARAFPQAGGPYAFPREAFGPLVGFMVAWSYWLSVVIGLGAIATGVVAPLASLASPIATHSTLITLLLVWALTLANCLDARLAGGIQLVTMLLKLLPLAGIILLAASIFADQGSASLPPFRTEDLHLGGRTGVSTAAALTLWAFLGLESATVPTERVKDAGRTIFRATLLGTAATGLIYLFACSSVSLLLPPEVGATSGAPMADFVRPYWGESAAAAMAVAAAVTAFGTLNGWILVQGEMPWAMAQNGVFPHWFARTSGRGTPIRAHLLSSLLLTAVLLLNAARGLVDLFNFLLLLATLGSLLPYLVCALAAVKLRRAANMPRGRWLVPIAILATIYSAWAIWGTGLQTIFWGLVLLAAGIPVYAAARGRATISTGP